LQSWHINMILFIEFPRASMVARRTVRKALNGGFWSDLAGLSGVKATLFTSVGPANAFAYARVEDEVCSSRP
jgi:hypothetical protein